MAVMVALCFLVSNPSPAASQEDGESEKIISSRALVVMPSVIRFRVRVIATRDEVTRIQLRVHEGETLLQSFDIPTPIDNLFIDFGDETEYEIIWDIRQTPLRPFSTLNYQFEVETTDGEIATVEEEFTFEDDKFQEWEMVESETLKIYSLGDAIDWSTHLAGLEQNIRLLRENTGFAAPVGLAIYPADTKICVEGEVPEDSPDATPPLVVMSEDKAFPCNPADMARVYANSDLVMAFVDAEDFFAQENQAFAAIFDLVYATRWENADVSAWFREGLRQLYSRVNQGQAIAAIKRASQEERVLPLAQMETSQSADSEDFALWQAQAYGLTLYLADIFGASTPFDIARAVSPSLSLRQAIEQITGLTTQRLYGRWLAWIDTARAIAAANWNPYLETTPTPLPTDTPSSIPPTHTPRPTATITPTPTSTFRGEIAATVFDPTYAPPTVPPVRTATPLPPGSLNPTPMLRPPADESNESSGLCGTGIGAILIPTLGIVWAGRKKRRHP